jgi:2-polyprenyl-6-hydroxyphenyl methylase/3-demethylubiquinone-9 3-methyltransferase
MLKKVRPRTLDRFEGIKNAVLRMAQKHGLKLPSEGYSVADIGCGAGTQVRLWAKEGHHVCGIDINEALLAIAEQRTEKEGFSINFKTGSAETIPLDNDSVDICLVPKLLEHVKNWQICLDEFSRILKPDGILFISTSNRFCPVQDEFTLPFYSWYPSAVKKYFEKLSTTTKPQIVNYAKYPALNWFSYFQLEKELNLRHIKCYDRLEAMDLESFSKLKRIAAQIFKMNKITRFALHIITPGTILFGIKESPSQLP